MHSDTLSQHTLVHYDRRPGQTAARTAQALAGAGTLLSRGPTWEASRSPPSAAASLGLITPEMLWGGECTLAPAPLIRDASRAFSWSRCPCEMDGQSRCLRLLTKQQLSSQFLCSYKCKMERRSCPRPGPGLGLAGSPGVLPSSHHRPCVSVVSLS